MDKTKFVDTKGACFLCGVTDDVTPQEMTEFSLRNICRYLNINPGSLLRKTVQKEDNLEDYEVRSCDFSVMLCSNCSSIATYLSDLISQLNLIQILITNQLQVFHQIISFPNYQSNESVTNHLEDALKQKAMQKCAAKVNSLLATYFPVVLLDKLEDHDLQGSLAKPKYNDLEENYVGSGPPKKTVITSTPSPSEYHEMPVLSPNTSLELENPGENGEPFSEDILPSPPPESNDLPLPKKPAPLNQKEVIVDICSNYFKRSGNSFQCSTCKYNTAQKNLSHIQTHIINSHPEVVFVQPSTTLSEEMFHEQCRQFLSEETRLAKERQQLPAAGPSAQMQRERSGYECEFCSKFFSNSAHFRFHLVIEHYTEVEGKLLKLDGSTTDNPEMKEIQTGMSGGIIPSKNTQLPKTKKWNCKTREGGCGKRFSNHLKFLQHKKGNCQNGGNKQRKPEPLGYSNNCIKTWKCDICGRDFLSKLNLKMHTKVHSAESRSAEQLN